jgi:transcriptional regulator GlxA family with amidase domain
VQNVVALLAEPVAAFELGVIAEVFGLDRSGDGLPRYDFSVCAQRPGLMQTSSGFAVHVAHGLDRLAAADLVAVPAWSEQALPPPKPVVTALRVAVERGARVLGVCSGAFLLAGAGLLDGRRAATHWRYAPALARRFPRVEVDPGVLYVADGPVVTSAGTAAAIDACLHLVREQHGSAVANAVARRMVVAAHRSGGQAQFVETPVAAAVPDDGLGDLLQWVRGHLDQPLSVDDLGRRALMSPRTFARRFRAATGTTPHRWLLDQRLLLAEHLLEDTDLGVEQVARRCGLGTADTLRHHFTARRRVSPLTYRRTFRQSASRSFADLAGPR